MHFVSRRRRQSVAVTVGRDVNSQCVCSRGGKAWLVACKQFDFARREMTSTARLAALGLRENASSYRHEPRSFLRLQHIHTGS